MKRIIITLALLVATAALAVVATGGDMFNEPEPTHTPEAQADFGVAGPDGQTVICKNGKELRVPKGLLNKLPPPPSQRSKADKADEGEKVWRCGEGKDPHRNPKLVDKKDDPLTRP